MDIYVIIKFKSWDHCGNSWEIEGQSFVMKSKAAKYVEDKSILKYVKVNLDEECQTKETDEMEIKSIAKKAFDKWRMETNG